MSRVFTMEYDDYFFVLRGLVEEERFQCVPGVYIDCPGDMTSIVFIWESAIHD
jgi:hypothetical protein